MATYRLKVAAQAAIVETWEVDADSPEEAENLLLGGGATFIDESVVGDETDREVIDCEEVERPGVER